MLCPISWMAVSPKNRPRTPRSPLTYKSRKTTVSYGDSPGRTQKLERNGHRRSEKSGRPSVSPSLHPRTLRSRRSPPERGDRRARSPQQKWIPPHVSRNVRRGSRFRSVSSTRSRSRSVSTSRRKIDLNELNLRNPVGASIDDHWSKSGQLYIFPVWNELVKGIFIVGHDVHRPFTRTSIKMEAPGSIWGFIPVET